MSNKISWLLLILSIVILAGCKKDASINGGAYMARTSIDSLNLTIKLLEGVEYKGGDETSALFCEEAQTRYSRSFSIRPTESIPEDIVDWKLVALDNEGAFYYRTERKEAVGSGGPEEHLIGYVVINGHYFKVTSGAMLHSPSPDSTWCIPMIQTLRYEGGR